MDSPSHPSLAANAGRPRLAPRAFEIAARLRSRRKQLNRTCVFVADKISVPEGRYRSWEKQLGPTTEKQYLEALARIIQVEPEWLAYGIGVAPIPAGEIESPQEMRDTNPRLTEQERMTLSKRALARRKALNLSRQEVALRIGIPTHGLKNWEFMLPQKRRAEFEEKWEAILGAPEGWLRQADMDTPPLSKDVLIQQIMAKAENVAGEIRMAAAWLSRASFARRTANYNALLPSEQRLADIFALRYGVEGESNTILQDIGNRYGLTRERIRQIVEKMAERADRLKLETPIIDRFAEEIRPHLPATVETLDGVFRELLGESLSVESVGRFCREILGRNIVAMTDKPADMTQSWAPTVIDPENHDAERIRAIRDITLRMIRNCGAAQVMFVAGTTGDALGRGILPNDVVRDCRMVPGFEWLIEQDGWFWYGEGKENRLVSAALKILVAAGQRVDVEEILAGFIRSRRGHYDPDRHRPYMILPPLQVVVEVLRRVKGLRNVQCDDFYLEQAIPMETVLSDAEKAVYGLMMENGNIASRHMLNSRLVDGGKVKHMALQVSLNHSPIYRQLDRGVFALRGVPLNSKFMKDAQDTVGGEARRVQLSAPDEHGYYCFQCELSEYMVRTRFWSLPEAFAKLLTEGEHTLEGFCDPVVFSRIAGGSNRLKRFISKVISTGLKAGDKFEMAINPIERRMRVTKLVDCPDFSLEPTPSGV